MPPLIDLDSATTSAPRMRASDADRLATVTRLQDAVARGLLTPEEGSDRMGDAFDAVHLTDLDPLTEDLPPAPAAPRRTPPGWRSLGALVAEQVRASLTASSGRLRAGRVAVVLLVAALFLVLAGALSGAALSDGGGGGGGGWDHHGYDIDRDRDGDWDGDRDD